MQYPRIEIPDSSIPRVADPVFQHLAETYASETNKTASVWRMFTGVDLDWRPHPRSSSVAEILKHQLLSERRFFGEFLGLPEPEAAAVPPAVLSVSSLRERMLQLARPRLPFLAERDAGWWLAIVPFFDAERQRIWVFWRRVLHTAHHRTQLTVYLRLMGKPVPATYGPTADVTWEGADPTLTVEAAARRAQG